MNSRLPARVLLAVVKPHGLALLLLVSPAVGASAQVAGEPTVFLTFYGGVAAGQASWRVNQPLCVWQTVIGGYQCEQGPSGPVNDTLTLSRGITTGLSLGIGLTKYLDQRIGFRVDLFYAEESISDHCGPASTFQADSDRKNQQACDQFSADNASLGLIAVAGSMLVRPFPTSSFSPYLRIGTGVVLPTGETLAASGSFFANGRTLTRQIITDSSGQGPRPYGLVAVGIQSGTALASRFQIEVQDAVIPLERIRAPADGNGRAPKTRSWTHNLSLTVGFAMVLSGRRGRRY